MTETTTANSNVYPDAEPLTVEKINEVMALMDEHRLPHSVYNVGSALMFRSWLERNKVIERKPLSIDQIAGSVGFMSTLSGIEVVETPALKYSQMAYVENGVIRGVFELQI